MEKKEKEKRQQKQQKDQNHNDRQAVERKKKDCEEQCICQCTTTAVATVYRRGRKNERMGQYQQPGGERGVEGRWERVLPISHGTV